MNKIKKVSIIGVGFMGGSLAFALKDKFPSVSVWGYARSQKSYNKLNKYKKIFHAERDIEKVVRDSDLIVFGLPVYAIAEYFTIISPYLKKGAIICDLSSTKEFIQKQAKKLLPKSVSFVGCHPLCGGEKSGVVYSKKDLYRGSLCVITSLAKLDPAKRVKKMWEQIGARVVFMNPVKHDKVLSYVSHLPHLISFSLTDSVDLNHVLFSSRSWSDLTRISGSPSNVWVDIFLSNKKNVLRDAKAFCRAMNKFCEIIESGDKLKLTNYISNVNSRHRRLTK